MISSDGSMNDVETLEGWDGLRNVSGRGVTEAELTA